MQASVSAQPGSVFLVGAGPGDPELLTLKAVRAIAAGTVILVDDLVNEAVLGHARPDARIAYVGKRGGCASTPQSLIERLMIDEALAGETVVRLKGGDPFIFGRGGEEIEALRAAGIAVQVINGITSGLAGLTALSIPWTHRDHAHGVVLVTGHAQPQAQGVDWRALAQTAQHCRLTLVIYMGVRSAAHIQQELLHGLPGDTPAAVVQNACLPQQRHVVCTLATLQATMHAAQLASPCIIVVGNVVRGLAEVGRVLPRGG